MNALTEFRNDIFKATFLAILTVSLLTAATHILSTQIAVKVPKLGWTLDMYTEKGGVGPNIVSNFFLSSEEITLVANVSGISEAPSAEAQVNFTIRGPPNAYQNITIVKTVKTNSSGIATATVPIPYNAEHPETVIGIWSASATVETTEGPITDTLAFEVKPPPKPSVDVYTDRGGEGPNTPSLPYNPGNKVYLYAEVSNGTAPIGNQAVAFAAYGPKNELVFITALRTNSSGIATTNFRIFSQSEISLGTWQVIVTVKIDDQVFFDALVFECVSA